jgi:hypothetical protein
MALALTTAVAATPWFLWHDDYPGMQQTGYELRLRGQDCAVLIYGDSSSLTGLDPKIIASITGLTACNISEGAPIQAVVGSNFPLDEYLKHNRRPRFLLAMYSPSGLKPFRAPFEVYQPEGVLYGLQYARNRTLALGLLRHPWWLMKFAIWAGHAMLADTANRLDGELGNARGDPRSQREERLGIWPFPLPSQSGCWRTAMHIDPASIGRYAASVADFRERYGRDGTKVIVNLAPVADCDVLGPLYRRQTEGLHDNPFEVVPIAFFNQGDVHFSAEGSRYISVAAGRQILALEAAGHDAGGGF